MSNLKLPTLSYAALDAALPARSTEAASGAGRSHTIGFKTRAYRFNDEICIQHHETTIATLSTDTVSVTPHGYVSSTTTARLHKVMVDNELWPNAYTVGIRNRELMVLTPNTMRLGLIPVPWYGVTFVNGTHGWVLVTRTTEKVTA